MLTGIVVIAAATLVFAPDLVSAWLGGLIGDVWAIALSAVIALFSGLFGAAFR